jgi:hypothetical protein
MWPVLTPSRRVVKVTARVTARHIIPSFSASLHLKSLEVKASELVPRNSHRLLSFLYVSHDHDIYRHRRLASALIAHSELNMVFSAE